MPFTSISSPTPYASPADFLSRYDVNVTGQLTSDSGQQNSATELLTDPDLITALMDASGDVEAACLVAGRYQPTDLQALTGVSLNYLKRITCALAAQYLVERRWSIEGYMPQYEQALAALDQLRNGLQIFAYAEVAAAGTPKNFYLNDNNFLNLNLVSNLSRYFGIRQDRKRPLG